MAVTRLARSLFIAFIVAVMVFWSWIVTAPPAKAVGLFTVSPSSQSCIWVKNHANAQYCAYPGYSYAKIVWMYVGSGWCVAWRVNGGPYYYTNGPVWRYLGTIDTHSAWAIANPVNCKV